jgi:hypothetical protein
MGPVLFFCSAITSCRGVRGGGSAAPPRARSYVVVLEIRSPSEANCSNGWW